MRLVLTAGFNGAPHAVALAEMATRDGHALAGALVVSPYNVARVRQLLRQRGTAALHRAIRRLAGRPGENPADDAVQRYLRSHDIRERKLSAWCRARSVPIRVVPDLNHARSIEVLRASACDGVLYAGGGIIRRPFIDAARGRILNAHSGPLPEIRGMNACEWALLLGLPPAVTIHFIDEGIDTGGIVSRTPIGVEQSDTVESLRGKCVVAGINAMLLAVPALGKPLRPSSSEAPTSRQCFSLAPVLRDLLDERLRTDPAKR